jgi:hypothetical protein
MQRATVLLQMQSVLVGIPKIHLSVRSLSSFWERPTFSSVHRYETKHAWYLEIKNLHLSRWGTESVCRIQKRMLHPLKILSAPSHRQSTRLWSALVMRCLRIHGFVFCKYTISLPYLRLRTFIFPGEEQKAYVESKNGCYIPFLVTLASDAERITWSLRACKSTAVI